jgi:hypothetical protein
MGRVCVASRAPLRCAASALRHLAIGFQPWGDGKSTDSQLEVAGLDTSIKGKLGMKRLGQDRLSASKWMPCSVI